ncbi:hypothetical protein [Neisseria sp.]|uniref:hypothetical protein n=1 Tax=Neisseria sp. TaxID=192066 RepID=UPI0035A11060
MPRAVEIGTGAFCDTGGMVYGYARLGGLTVPTFWGRNGWRFPGYGGQTVKRWLSAIPMRALLQQKQKGRLKSFQTALACPVVRNG